MRRHANRAVISGAAIAVAHFVLICGLAAIVIREQQSGMSQEYWEYAGIFDLPVSLVLLLLSPLLNLLSGVASWPDVAFLPGITGSWNRFLLPFLFYGVLGTAVWYLLGWAVMRFAGSRHLP
ncbi:MAG: hypothetical protein QOJ45_1102 [Verrucomicrobiota bacterium]